MVLFKRKPVRFLPPTDIKDDNAEVWHIPQTGEVFGQYEDYLARMDFYKQRRFNCQISGHSGLTFFEALKSETAGAEEVEQAFPEALKGPVLRRVQFQTVSRIDTLVDMVFEDFRSDYYPGEAVTVKLANGERLKGSVREKTRFGHKVLPDGTIKPPSTKYFVSIDDREDAEAVVDDSHIFRDRKIFTKAVLRSFIKRTAEAAEPEVKHRAQDLLEEYEWIDHLRKRDFKDGGWEMIMVGLLHQLSKEPRLEKSCEELLEQLVPRSVDPTQETVLRAYANLDVNYRVQALQIICMLTMRTKAIRAYMEDCSETMTGYRKEKIEWQRQRKQAVEELKVLNDQRKALLPEETPQDPAKAEEDAKAATTDVDSPAKADTPTKEGDGSDSEEDAQTRKNGRRPNDRTLERQRKRKEEKERKEKAAEAAKVPKQSKQLIKNAKDIQKKEEFIKKCEDEVAILDNDLREADCPRTRVLGRDRFWNRYYWFERNGMPYGGLPDSSTASADYANACIWVQGPDDLEREGYIDLSKEHQDEYKAKHNMTVPERKKMEEGATSVFNAGQWGYYDDPESVDNLIRWLDPRGYNELKLRKEILSFKDKIAKYMENRKEYLAPAEKEEEESKEPKRGVATRTRQQQTPEPTNYRCLAWENTVAMEELGHLHSEPPPPPRNKKQARKRQAVDPTPEPPSAPKTRRKK
ncbi:hypothetical protein BN1723_012552 [Verticillium longisporum]|uniref:WAC domain-containing protein n=1 Tax=Verticillium longisporum TaxID=100787 RepID=A0A0G4LJ50_VERLO|nr:hypothetical protein BN1723_012552 [Verticillium longisporum]